MKIVWQVSEEWYGKNAIAYPEGLIVRIRHIDNKAFYTIHDDDQIVYRGEAGSLEQAQEFSTAQVRRITLSRKLKSYFSGKAKKVG